MSFARLIYADFRGEEINGMAFDPREQLALVPVVAQQSSWMIQTYRDWPASHWQRETACPGWSAADVVAHLATGAEYYTQVITAGRTGEPGLPWGANSLDELRAIRAAAGDRLRSGGPEVLLNGFEQAAHQLQATFESLRLGDVEKLAWYPLGPIPMGQWIGMRLIELSVHDWDIHRPHDDTFHLSPIALPSLMTSLPEMQVRLLSYRCPETLHGVYAMHADETHWALHVEDRRITFHQDMPATCTASLQTDAEHLVLLTLGRADFAVQLQTGGCTLSGDPEAGKSFYELLFSPYLSASATSSP